MSVLLLYHSNVSEDVKGLSNKGYTEPLEMKEDISKERQRWIRTA